MTKANEAAYGHGSENGHCCGLTKRELYALEFSKELFGALYTNPDFLKHWKHDGVAIQGIAMADALIAALSKGEGQ